MHISCTKRTLHDKRGVKMSKVTVSPEEELQDVITQTINTLRDANVPLQNGRSIPFMANWYLTDKGLAFGDTHAPYTVRAFLSEQDDDWLLRETIKRLHQMAPVCRVCRD